MRASGRDAVIGLDLGTSSMKGLLVTVDGAAWEQARAAYPMHSPQPGWNENDPQDWWTAFCEVVTELTGRAGVLGWRVRGLGVVAQRDPFVLLDAVGNPVTRAISWTDQRTHEEVARLRATFGDEHLVRVTGTRPIVGQGLPNLMWTMRHLPGVWSQAARAVAPKDFLLHRLLAAAPAVTDPTTPSRSLAYDIERGAWSDEILDAAGISSTLFDLTDSAPWERAGEVDPAVAASLGLPLDLVVAVGGADDQAATLGAGAVRPGEVCLGTGTCSGWRLVLDGYRPDVSGRGDTYPHVVPDRYIREVTIDSTGSSLRWFVRTLAADLGGYDEVIALAATAPVGAAGVRFFPYVDGGQRAPHFLDAGTGVFVGITSFHDRAHLARAVLEGITMQYPRTWEILREGNAVPVSGLTMVDAEAASLTWTKIKADVLGEPVRLPAITAGAATGAAVLAATAAGIHGSVTDAAQAMVHMGTTVEPDPAGVQAYRAVAQRYETDMAVLRPLLSTGGVR